MFLIVAIDALEYDLVEEYDCKNLKQSFYGKTDISEFSEPRTLVLWSSFMAGKNKESEVLSAGNAEMWNIRIDIKETFFSKFKNPKIIDLPGFSYDLDAHKRSRKLLKAFFETDDPEIKEIIKNDYNEDAFNHHNNVKTEFNDALESDHDLILGYFSVIDVIGHLNFGNITLMKILYKEMDEIVGKLKGRFDCPLLVLSDHGMKAVGNFGDHSNYGFWSTNFDSGLSNPKITDFYTIVLNEV